MTKTRKTKRVNSFPKLLFWSDTTTLLSWIVVIKNYFCMSYIWNESKPVCIRDDDEKGWNFPRFCDRQSRRKKAATYLSIHPSSLTLLLRENATCSLSLSLSLSQTHTLSHANVLYYFSPTYFLEKCLVNEVKRNQKCCTVTFFSILQL